MGIRPKKPLAKIKTPDIPDDISAEGLPGGVVAVWGAYDYLQLLHVDLVGNWCIRSLGGWLGD